MFQINPSAPTPIYRQIVDQIRREIAGGQLAAGVELPSVRATALQHAINPMTVSKAYSLLEAEGLLCRKRGMGMTVAEQSTQNSHQQRIDLLAPHLQGAARIAHQLQVDPAAALVFFKACLERAAERSDIPTTAKKEQP